MIKNRLTQARSMRDMMEEKELVSLEDIKTKSYKDFKSKQGYKVIKFLKLNPIEVFEGGLSICDYCNTFGLEGYYIPVLNRYYCEKCFSDFESRTPFYEEDLVFEEQQYVNIICRLDTICKNLYKIINNK